MVSLVSRRCLASWGSTQVTTRIAHAYYLEPVQGCEQISDQRIELGLGDTHARMRGFHAQADIPIADGARSIVLWMFDMFRYVAHAVTTVNMIPDMAGQ